MKTITFLTVTLIGFVIATAAATPPKTRFSTDEPISFNERGIEFFVFQNGEFDFNTAPTRTEILYRDGRRSNNQTYGAPVAEAVRIEHDALGRVRRIGNVFLNYDALGRIKRIGSVYMSYNRFALTQVGNLRIIYDRFGRITTITGSVKGFEAAHEAVVWENGAHYNNNDPQLYYRTNGTKIERKN